MLKKYLKQSRIVLLIRIVHEKLLEAIACTKYIADGNKFKDSEKLKTDLIIRAHAIEKGMSIGKVKIGFGQAKVINLLKDLQTYLQIRGSKETVNDICSIIKKYISFNKELGADMQKIEHLFSDFCSKNKVETNESGGIYYFNYEDIKENSSKNFEIFSQSRFSIRDFSNKPIEIDLIKKALKLCERTPSACNRQSWSIYIFQDEQQKKLLFNLQKGCNGFYQDMQYAILLCGNLSRYNFHELNQVYVDGGIYAMNLMYALHFYGVANIPLTMGHKQKQLKTIKNMLNIPDNEIPIVLIGAGAYKENYKVAVSERNDYSLYTKFI